MPRSYELVRSLRPGKSKFDLSYSHILTADMGKLYVAGWYEAVPGDYFDIGVSITARMMPLVLPVLHPISIKTATMFCPTRILDEDNWPDFITGGREGTDSYSLPTWSPSDTAVGSLWDVLGLPVGITPDANHLPIDYLKRVYNRCWNEYFREQNLVAEINETTSEDILDVAQRKDYFTSALPWQQRGTPPSLPINGTIDATDGFGGTVSGAEDLRVNTSEDLLFRSGS